MSDFLPRTRIAPTPSGMLHPGNLFAFVLTWLIAKRDGGTVRLRIDDLDAARMRNAYLEDIFNALDFLELVPDEGPSGVDDFLKNHSQLHRLHLYRTLTGQLRAAGNLYACTCSRSKVQFANAAGVYPGTCRIAGIDLDEANVAWRLRLPENGETAISDAITGRQIKVNLHEQMGDFVVRRKDGLPAYQLASVADDVYYGINLVVRGEDLLPSTAAQIQLAAMAGLLPFEGIRWHHHLLVKNLSGEKLSKSAGHNPVSLLVTGGLSRPVFFAWIAGLLGLPERPYASLFDLLEEFANPQQQKK